MYKRQSQYRLEDHNYANDAASDGDNDRGDDNNHDTLTTELTSYDKGYNGDGRYVRETFPASIRHGNATPPLVPDPLPDTNRLLLTLHVINIAVRQINNSARASTQLPPSFHNAY